MFVTPRPSANLGLGINFPSSPNQVDGRESYAIDTRIPDYRS